jgi:hypothetical protein
LKVPLGLRGELRLALGLRDDAGRIATSRLAVTTERRLSRKRAMRRIRQLVNDRADGEAGAGYYTTVGHCRRFSQRRLECQAIETTYDGNHEHRVCASAIIATLRPDGMRIGEKRGRRMCRRLD